MRRYPVTRYIPKDAEERRFDDIPAVVYLYEKNGTPLAVAYGGKRNKPDWHFGFANPERREQKIIEWIASLKAHTENIKAYREKRKENPSDHAKGAANLKADLEKNFPGVKFSVRSDTFAGGNAIRVSWTDGPTEKDVQEIADQYQHGWFDGMTDCYNYTSGDYSRGSAKWVTWSRHISPALYIQAAKMIGYDINTGESDRMGNLPGLDYEQSHHVYRKAREMSYMKGGSPS